jgi:CopG family transcriptional regulator, nickel-responsive regulator
VLRLSLKRATMEKITRFGVSIEPSLLEKFDRMMKKKRYSNRSEAIRDIIRDHLVREHVKDPTATVIGTLTMVYNHHAGPLVDRLLAIQHDHYHEILTTTHIHIDHKICLEVLVLKGKTRNIKKLADTITALKGIKHGELVITQQQI